jgi:predicted HicB family RNase H-like nuclease
MGISIRIGEAVLKERDWYEDDNDDIYFCYYDVDDMCLDEAPDLLNDDFVRNSNCRLPSCTAWVEFTKETGLYEFFFNKETGLFSPLYGCAAFDKKDVEVVQQALKARQQYADEHGLVPGFEPGDPEERKNFKIKIDPTLLRLIWLEFWMNWAINNCKNPAITS